MCVCVCVRVHVYTVQVEHGMTSYPTLQMPSVKPSASALLAWRLDGAPATDMVSC